MARRLTPQCIELNTDCKRSLTHIDNVRNDLCLFGGAFLGGRDLSLPLTKLLVKPGPREQRNANLNYDTAAEKPRKKQ